MTTRGTAAAAAAAVVWSVMTLQQALETRIRRDSRQTEQTLFYMYIYVLLGMLLSCTLLGIGETSITSKVGISKWTLVV